VFSWLRSERQRASRNQRPPTVGFDTLLAALAAAQPANTVPRVEEHARYERASRNQRPSKAGFDTLLAALAAAQPADTVPLAAAQPADTVQLVEEAERRAEERGTSVSKPTRPSRNQRPYGRAAIASRK
jgi:hypothetical protein